MQINRLFQMIYLLLNREKITAKELAERFEVSTRTIYRDLDVLSEAGIPIYATKGKNGGISLLPDFVLNKSVLSEEEQKGILFSLQGLSAIGEQDAAPVLKKMEAFFQKEERNWIEVDFSEWASGAEQRDKFDLIKKAVLGQYLLRFTYSNTSGEQGERTIEPMMLRFKNAAWYLQGYCRNKQDFRVFKISRIQNLSLLEEPFDLRPAPDISLAVDSPMDLMELEMRCAPEIAFLIYDSFDPQSITRQEDGYLHVKTWYPEDHWAYGHLLSFGNMIEVLSPKRVREKLHRLAKKTADLYE